jgi:hypothetical protein
MMFRRLEKIRLLQGHDDAYILFGFVFGFVANAARIQRD